MGFIPSAASDFSSISPEGSHSLTQSVRGVVTGRGALIEPLGSCGLVGRLARIGFQRGDGGQFGENGAYDLERSSARDVKADVGEMTLLGQPQR